MSRGHVFVESAVRSEAQERIWDSFRRWGYLQANLDPLGDLDPVAMPELELSGPDADAARRFYCGTIGVEFMHIPDRERRLWIQERMESETTPVDRAAHSRTPGQGGNFRADDSVALSRHKTLFSRR